MRTLSDGSRVCHCSKCRKLQYSVPKKEDPKLPKPHEDVKPVQTPVKAPEKFDFDLDEPETSAPPVEVTDDPNSINLQVRARVPHALRAPCSSCGSTKGLLTERGTQDTVFCASCNTFQYNAPRAETGKPVRHVKTRETLDIQVRARVLARDNARCVMCGASAADTQLHVGHLLSVAAGTSLGLSSTELNDEDNLAAMCDACNHGLGAAPVPLKLWAGVIMSRMRQGKGTSVKTVPPLAPPLPNGRLTELPDELIPAKLPRGSRDAVKLKVVKSTSGGGKTLTPAEWQVMFKAAMAEAIGVHTTGDLPR